MKRMMLCFLAVLLILSGCAAAQDDPFRVDTVVQIPVDPTDAPTQAPTEDSTEPPTEAPTEAPTEVPTKPAPTEEPKKSSSSKGSSGKGSSGKTEKPKTTEPAAVETVAPTQAPTEPPFDPSSYSIGGLEYDILDIFNGYREESGSSGLTISGKLSGIAYLRAKEAADSWSHTRPDGRSYTSALSDYGYGYSTVEELMVSSGSSDAEILAAGWLGSSSHSSKLLSESYSKVGIGVYRAGGMTYVVCLLVG